MSGTCISYGNYLTFTDDAGRGLIRYGFSVTVLLLLLIIILLSGCQKERDRGLREAGHIAVIDSLVEAEIESGNLPGAVVRIQKGDSIWHSKAYGHARKYNYGIELMEEPQSMTTEHLFDLASLTKVFATTFGIMMLRDQGLVLLDDPLGLYFPEFSQGDKSKITIRHLLNHTSGLPQWYPLYYKASDADERFRAITEMDLKWDVGEDRHYSDLGFMLLGDLIEKRSGLSLEEYLDENLYSLLGLRNTVFNPLQKGFKADLITATSHGNPFEKRMVYDDSFGYKVDVDPDSWDGWREYTLQGEVNDGNAWYANGGLAGHAGLFSTAEELQVLIDLLVNEGQFNGIELISRETVRAFLKPDEFDHGLGWAMNPSVFSAEGAPAGTFGHTGFTGTSVVVLPHQELSIILLTNRQHDGLQDDGTYFNLGPLRQAIADKIREEVKGINP